MGSIRAKNTRPEMKVRKLLWRMGKRYRVHDRTIAGVPDISNRRAKLAIFIDGCFWHGCATCYTEPRSNVEFWRKKLRGNKRRRKAVERDLKTTGWEVLVFWEHEVKADPQGVASRIARRIPVRLTASSKEKVLPGGCVASACKPPSL